MQLVFLLALSAGRLFAQGVMPDPAAVQSEALDTTASAESIVEREIPTTTSITGRVIWDAEIPVLPDFRVEVDRPYCGGTDGFRKQALDDINPLTLAVANCIVHLETNTATLAPEPPAALELRPEMHLADCRIATATQLLAPNQHVMIRNMDEIVHRVRIRNLAQTKSTTMDLAYRNAARPFEAGAEDFYTVRCDRHPWEYGAIIIAPHKYYAITDRNGSFRFEGMPAGSYQVKVRHAAFQADPVRKNGIVVDYVFEDPPAAEQQVSIGAQRNPEILLKLRPASR